MTKCSAPWVILTLHVLMHSHRTICPIDKTLHPRQPSNDYLPMSNTWTSSNFLLRTDDGPNNDNIDIQSVTNSSLYSTNYTMSNLVGQGRVLGNLYSYTGRNLEIFSSRAAHKAGFGPTATYEKIEQLYRSGWTYSGSTSEFIRHDNSIRRLIYKQSCACSICASDYLIML